MTDLPPSVGESGPGLSRRLFIAASSVVAAAPAWTWITRTPTGLQPPSWTGPTTTAPTTVPNRPDLRAPLGYVAGSDSLADLSAIPYGAATVRPATALASGDPWFTTGLARISVLGLTPGVAALHQEVKGAALDAHFPASGSLLNLGKTFPFYAWNLQMTPYSASSPTSFVAPAARTGFALHLMVNRVTTGKATTRVSFTAGTAAGTPRLRRGIYLLGLLPSAWADNQALPPVGAPAWSRLGSLVITVDRA